MKTIISITLILLCLSMIKSDFHIRETELGTLWINIPIDPKEMQEIIHPDLKPSIYNGKAWFHIMLFNIDNVATKLFDTWVSMPGTGGLSGKVSALVETNRGEKGYTIFQIDMEPGVQGWMKKVGCSKTQIGVQCNVAKEYTFNTNSAKWVSPNSELTAVYELDGDYTDIAFRDFVLNRDFKFSFEKGGKLMYNVQEDTRNPNNYRVNGLKNVMVRSSILNKRLSTKLSVETDICKANQCFYGAFYRFEDHTAVEYKK